MDMRRIGLAAGLVAAACMVGFTASGAQAADAKAGEAIYEKQCQTCHGKSGAGDGAAAAKMKDKPANWTAGGLKAMDDAKIHEIIKKGGGAVGKSKAMPAYGKLADADLDNVVAYVKTLAK
jgi:mono/diheme cytochrome c family protein